MDADFFLQDKETHNMVSAVKLADNWLQDRAMTGPNDAVAMSSTNGLVGIGFASRYRLQPRAVFLKAQWVGVKPLHPLLSH